MKGVNSYGNELTPQNINNKMHRSFVGGLWEEVGLLQFNFLKSQGLLPTHKLLDIGCGCMRGGVHYVSYLESGNYYGLDVNESLIQAGTFEIKDAKLEGKCPTLLIDDQFRLGKFGESFDFMVSVSLFTHLPMNIIIRCLCMVRKNLRSDGIYFSTFFQSPTSANLEKLTHQPGGVVTNYDADPFHYSLEEISWMAGIAGLKVRLIDWEHPRNQKIAAFSIMREIP